MTSHTPWNTCSGVTRASSTARDIRPSRSWNERGEPAPELRERLQNLARPALGHWWEFVRLLLPPMAGAGDEGFSRARDLILGRARDDLPRASGLDAALREDLDGTTGARATVR